MDNQVPRGDPNLKCPLWKKPMEQVCHTCPLWVQVRGKHPQTLETMDRWNCSLAWLPMLLLENAQRQIQNSASIDKVATEIQAGRQQSHETTVMLTGLLNRAMDIDKGRAYLTNGAEDIKRIEAP